MPAGAPNLIMKKQTTGFTLIEMLIVIGLLGALAVLVIPRVTVSRTAAWNASLIPQEMSRIQAAFDAFACDCVPTSNDLVKIAESGLSVLMEYDDATGWSFPENYDAMRGKGWRGPYIQPEGIVNGLPVLYDPFYSEERAAAFTNHYYRVVQTNDLQVVAVGLDHEFETEDDICCDLYLN